MNDKQNIADLIGALAEDIEEIKKKLDAQGGSDKDACYTFLWWQYT